MPTWTKEVVDLSVAGAALTIDDIKIDGTTIGHTDDTDLLTLTNGSLAIAGAVTGVTTLTTSGNTTIGGDLTISGSKLTFGNASVIDNETATKLIFSGETSYEFKSTSGNNLKMFLTADAGEDNADQWRLNVNDGGDVKWSSYTSGSFVNKVEWDTSGNLTIAGDLAITGGNITSALTCDSTLTVTSALTASSYLDITVTTDSSDASGDTGALRCEGGASIAKKLYVGTDLDVDGTTNLDVVDIDGAVQLDSTLTVGVDGTGYDVTFFGDTASSYMLWDQSEDKLKIITANDSEAIRLKSSESGASSGPNIGLVRDGSSVADGDDIGAVNFIGEDNGGSEHRYGAIAGEIVTKADNANEGRVRIKVSHHDGGGTNATNAGLTITGKADSTIDVTLGYGATSTTTVAGDLDVDGGDIVAGANSSTQGTLKLWDGGGGNTPGYIVLYSPNGTANYIFCEDDGTLKRHTSAPTANGDGSEIGGQS
jgi:hypothetical protein